MTPDEHKDFYKYWFMKTDLLGMLYRHFNIIPSMAIKKRRISDFYNYPVEITEEIRIDAEEKI